MKKISVLSFFLMTGLNAALLFSMDFGGYLDNSTEISISDETEFYQIDRIRLWFSSPLGKNWSFLAMGNYTFELEYPYLFDLEQLSFSGEWPDAETNLSLFSLQLGRFGFSEFSRFVLNHAADGIRFSFDYPSAMVSLGFGYTGLLSKYGSNIMLSKAEGNDMLNPDILFASPRVLGIFQVHFPEYIARQDLYLSALFQKDLRTGSAIIEEGETDYLLSGNKGGLYDSIYAGAGASGTITGTLYYNAFGYFETGRTLSLLDDVESSTGKIYQYMPVIAFMGGAEISYFMESLLYSTCNLSFVYSTGDADSSSVIEENTKGFSNVFNPISGQEVSIIFNPAVSNIFYIKGSYSIKPLSMLGNKLLENIVAILDATVFFRSTTGGFTDQMGLNPDSNGLYLGSEIDCIIVFRPFSDLGVSLSAGYFIPNNGSDGVFYTDERTQEFAVKCEFSLSF